MRIAKSYEKPLISSKKIKLNYFYRADHWFNDIESLFIHETYAQGSGGTIFLPFIVKDDGGGGGGSGGGGGGS